MEAPADVAIVGGGAAGCVLANRLSQSPGCRVVLIEAGRDMAPDNVPADVRSLFPLSTFNPAYFWPDLRVHWRTAEAARPSPMLQGRVMGGGSAVMGMWAMRGRPEDYDGWQARGAEGWDWNGVLPFFRRLEQDCDFAGPLHGTDGPIPIRRQPRENWPAFSRAVADAAAGLGFAEVDDMNADFGDGHCLLPVSRFEDRRASAGLCYLSRPVRSRPNLRIVADTTAQRLTLDGARATGVLAAGPDGQARHFPARTVVVAAGALASPVLLMRSGIGPAASLRATGVDVVQNLPGVGRNLQTHPILVTLGLLRRGFRDGRMDRPPATTFLRWSSGLDGCQPGDMSMYVRGFLAWHVLGRRMAMLAPVLGSPASRGTVQLDAGAPGGARVEFNLLNDERDLARMVGGIRLAASLFRGPAVRAACDEAFVLDMPPWLARLNQRSRLNGAVARLLTLGLDVSPRVCD